MKIEERLDWGPLATFSPNKKEPVYNWYYYKESFSKGLVTNILDMLGARSGLVLDPFCGVGTAVLACKERGIDGIGFDVHPLAVFVSRIKLRDYNWSDIETEMDRVLNAKFVEPNLRIQNNLIKKGFPKHAIEEIVFYRDQIMATRNKDIRDLLLLGLMNVTMRCSWINKDGAVLKIKRKKSTPLPRKIIKHQFKIMLNDLDRYRSGKSRVRADFGNARKMGLADNVIDYIITSPPYLNKREYEKVFSIEQGLFLDMIGMETHSEYIGSDLRELGKDSGKLAKILEGVKIPKSAMPYFMDMYQAIEEMYRVCRKGAKVAMVVGNGCFPSGVVASDVILSNIAASIGFNPKNIIVLNKRQCTKNRTKRVGELRESLLIWEK